MDAAPVISMDSLRDLGYSVELAFTLDDCDVYSVSGHGVLTYVRSDDPEAAAALADVPGQLADNAAPLAPAAGPSVPEKVLAALEGLDPSTATVADVINAVKSALA